MFGGQIVCVDDNSRHDNCVLVSSHSTPFVPLTVLFVTRGNNEQENMQCLCVRLMSCSILLEEVHSCFDGSFTGGAAAEAKPTRRFLHRNTKQLIFLEMYYVIIFMFCFLPETRTFQPG